MRQPTWPVRSRRYSLPARWPPALHFPASSRAALPKLARARRAPAAVVRDLAALLAAPPAVLLGPLTARAAGNRLCRVATDNGGDHGNPRIDTTSDVALHRHGGGAHEPVPDGNPLGPCGNQREAQQSRQ